MTEYKNEPLVSVIMPAYNGSEFIREAIQSVTDQTYQNWELIVIDDGSVDDTTDIVKTFKDPRIHLFKNGMNQGIAYSTNFGIRQSHGKYIALLDDDDVAAQRRLEWQVEYLENHPGTDVLGGSDAEIDEKGNIIKYGGEPLHNPALIKAYLLFYKNMFTDCTVMYRKSFIEEHQIWYEEHTYGMHDLKFYMDCSKKGTITAINELLLYKRVYSTQETMLQLRNNGKARAEKFAQMQRESIKKSGFQLSQEQLQTINDLVPEEMKESYSIKDLRKLYLVFREMVAQAEKMKLDFVPELAYACKKILSTRVLVRVDIFHELDD